MIFIFFQSEEDLQRPDGVHVAESRLSSVPQWAGLHESQGERCAHCSLVLLKNNSILSGANSVDLSYFMVILPLGLLGASLLLRGQVQEWPELADSPRAHPPVSDQRQRDACESGGGHRPPGSHQQSGERWRFHSLISLSVSSLHLAFIWDGFNCLFFPISQRLHHPAHSARDAGTPPNRARDRERRSYQRHPEDDLRVQWGGHPDRCRDDPAFGKNCFMSPCKSYI